MSPNSSAERMILGKRNRWRAEISRAIGEERMSKSQILGGY
jgi:hypothetical protein